MEQCPIYFTSLLFSGSHRAHTWLGHSRVLYRSNDSVNNVMTLISCLLQSSSSVLFEIYLQAHCCKVSQILWVAVLFLKWMSLFQAFLLTLHADVWFLERNGKGAASKKNHKKRLHIFPQFLLTTFSEHICLSNSFIFHITFPISFSLSQGIIPVYSWYASSRNSFLPILLSHLQINVTFAGWSVLKSFLNILVRGVFSQENILTR